MPVSFTAHNIRLDDGTFTKPDEGFSMDAHPWFVSARRVLEAVFPSDRTALRLVDVGCLEGGYSVEFARMGFQVLGIEVRDVNLAACNYVKSRTELPNLEFAKDDARNVANYGEFDAAFCCGLLYHLEKPKEFLKTLSSVTRKVLILQTHFSTDTLQANLLPLIPSPGKKLLARATKTWKDKFRLSRLAMNEGLLGRWFVEFTDVKSTSSKREAARWASWDNPRSFWIQREYLLQSIQEAGFDLVMEQFDNLGPDITASMTHGYYRTDRRGTFVGIKTGIQSGRSA